MSTPISLAKARGNARRLAMQALYQWQMSGDDITDIKHQFLEGNDAEKFDSDYFSELVLGVLEHLEDIDAALQKHMSRNVSHVDPVERAIIRIAAYEFIKRIDVPYKVVLNEAITLTKKFCSEQSHTFVNGVLDKVAHEIRPRETSS